MKYVPQTVLSSHKNPKTTEIGLQIVIVLKLLCGHTAIQLYLNVLCYLLRASRNCTKSILN